MQQTALATVGILLQVDARALRAVLDYDSLWASRDPGAGRESAPSFAEEHR